MPLRTTSQPPDFPAGAGRLMTKTDYGRWLQGRWQHGPWQQSELSESRDAAKDARRYPRINQRILVTQRRKVCRGRLATLAGQTRRAGLAALTGRRRHGTLIRLFGS